jgi:hypothetical protein
MRPGAFRDAKPANDEVRDLLASLKSEVVSRLGLSDEIGMEAHSFTSRAVLGGNFTIKVILSNADVIHIKANKLPSGPVLVAVATGLTKDSPIEPLS